MDIIRIGNDINVTWNVYGRNGAKYSLTGKIHRLWLVSGPRKKEITAYSQQLRNQIVFVIDDKDVHRFGTFKLILEIKEPDNDTQDATYELSHVFQVVSETYPMRANKSINGQADIVINSVLNNVYVSTLEGASAYEIAVQNGYEGTVTEWLGEFIASIRCEWPDLIFTRADNSEISVDLTHTHPAYEEELERLAGLIGNLSIVNNGSYYTLNIGGLSIPFYSKEQVDALVNRGGSGDVTPDDPEDAYLHFTKNEFKLDAQGNVITAGGIGVESNVTWVISAEALPDKEQDEQSGTDTSTALNVYPTTIILEVGKTEQIKEV